MSQIAIKTQVFDFTCTNEIIARQLQQEIDANLATELNTIIERVIQEVVKEDEFLKIDKVELDLGEVRILELQERELWDRFAAQFTQSLRQIQNQQSEAVIWQSNVQPSNNSFSAAWAADYELLTAFCWQGDLPWWADKPASLAFDAVIRRLMVQDAVNFKNWLMEACLQPAVLYRLAMQCKPATKMLLTTRMPELSSIFAGGSWLQNSGVKVSVYLFSPAQRAQLQAILKQNQYRVSAPYDLLLERLAAVSDWSGLEQAECFHKFSPAELTFLKAFAEKETQPNRRAKAKLLKLLKRLTMLEVEFLLFLIALEANVLTKKSLESAGQADDNLARFSEQPYMPVIPRDTYSSAGLMRDQELRDNQAEESASPLIHSLTRNSVPVAAGTQVEIPSSSTETDSEDSDCAGSAPSIPNNKEGVSSDINHLAAPSPALEPIIQSPDDPLGNPSQAFLLGNKVSQNRTGNLIKMPAEVSGSVKTEGPEAVHGLAGDTSNFSTQQNSESVPQAVKVLPNELSPGQPDSKGTAFLEESSKIEGDIPEKRSDSGKIINTAEPEKPGKDQHSYMQEHTALGQPVIQETSAINELLPVDNNRLMDQPGNKATSAREKLAQNENASAGKSAIIKGIINATALKTPEELSDVRKEFTLTHSEVHEPAGPDEPVPAPDNALSLVSNQLRELIDKRRTNQFVNFISRKLPLLHPVLLEHLSQWKRSDWMHLKADWAKHRQLNPEVREMVKQLIAHPALLQYNLLGVLASLSFAETPQSLLGQPGTWPPESSPKTIPQKVIKSLQAAHHLFSAAVKRWSLSEKVTVLAILQKRKMDTPGEEKVLRRILHRLPTECLLILQFLTELPEPVLERLGTAEKPLTTFPEQGNQPSNIFQEKLAPSGKIYLENAGLCLLALYFPGLFAQLGYLENNNFKNKYLANRALYLTQYLVTGKSGSPEYLLPLNKLFCGFGLTDWVASGIRLTKKETAEAADLLQSVIAHWKALKNTTRPGFREAFLQRKGILLVEEDYWTLQVERKGHDLLLNTLPWTFNMIKLPWMKKMLQVEW